MLAEIDPPRMTRSGTDILELRPQPFAHSRDDVKPGPLSRRGKIRRGLNFMIALLAIIVALPVMLVSAIAIKLTSPGPVLLRHRRVGIDRRSPVQEPGILRRQVDYGGRLFTLYTFRTTHHDPSDRRRAWAGEADPPVSPVGRVLRRFRLDRLPQLFNVLLGDMNVVGPRPEPPETVMGLREQIDQYARRQRVLPGITGLAQVRGLCDRCPSDVARKVADDLEYIGRQSAMEDLRIIIRTVPSVFIRSP